MPKHGKASDTEPLLAVGMPLNNDNSKARMQDLQANASFRCLSLFTWLRSVGKSKFVGNHDEPHSDNSAEKKSPIGLLQLVSTWRRDLQHFYLSSYSISVSFR